METYFIITYGCQANHSDSERVAAVLESCGYKQAKNKEGTDVLVFNTCSVRQSAEDRIFGRNKELQKVKQKNPKLKVILTGCMMHYKEQVLKKRLPDIDIFLPIRGLMHLPEKLGKQMQEKPENYLSFKPKPQSSFRAYVPISFGCNNFCTFCIVPFSRGREYSRPTEEILNEVKDFVSRGYKEIWLLGQNVNSYGISDYGEKTVWAGINRKGCPPKLQKGRVSFAELLKKVNGIPGDFWIRFHSPHPKDFSQDVIEIMAKCKKVPKYTNLPVQAGSNEILQKMNRIYNIEQYKNLVSKMRSAMPNLALSTDVIVGFPGETEMQFKKTINLFKELKFDMAYISQYSERSKTASSIAFKDDVPHAEKERRDKVLTSALKETALENNKKLVGTTTRVLVDEIKDGTAFGRTEGYKNIQVLSDVARPTVGEFINIKITDARPWSLKGKKL